MTTQQSGFIGPGDAESSQVLVKSLVKAAFRGEHCSGLLGRTSLRLWEVRGGDGDGFLFRPSRPDFIETFHFLSQYGSIRICSGLLGRTSLRRSRT